MSPNTNASSVQGHEIVGDPGTPSETKRLMDFIPIHIPTVERGALSRSRRKRKRRFLDFIRAHPSKDWFLRSTFVGRRRQDQASSPPTDSDDGDGGGESGQPRRRFRVPFVRKIKWGKLWSYAVSWCRKPANLAMLVWLGFVAAGLLIVLMLMTGMLNSAIPKEELRKRWTEVVNQILNALFTIMCLYQHPKIFHHLVLLLRWRDLGGDREEVQKVYCKNGAARPHDRAHMLVVVALLHLTCAAQYYCCALFWSYSRRDRPDWALNIGYGLGTGCPVVAGLYAAYSPLGRKRPDEPTDTESSSSSGGAADELGSQRAENDGVAEIKIYNRRVVVSSPEWSGGLLDVLRVRVEHGAPRARQHVRARLHLRPALRRADPHLQRDSAQRARSGHSQHRGRGRRALGLLRVPLRRVLAHADTPSGFSAGAARWCRRCARPTSTTWRMTGSWPCSTRGTTCSCRCRGRRPP
jgi:hypothetical protein